MSNDDKEKKPWIPAKPEPEHQGSIWTHPYMIYIWLTAILFVVLLVIAWLGYENDWIPNRGFN